jgi:hypothetical protein
MNVPEWLSKREGGLKAGLTSSSLFVLLDGHPQYQLVAVPAKGKFTCVVTQTINGKRVNPGQTYDGVPSALEGGLEELRQKLGW